MAVTLETKLRWFERGAAAFEERYPGVIEQVVGPGAPPHYVCPVCVEGFPREDVAKGNLTEEHVPPEALGGRGLVLTCRDCNSTAGSELDSHAHRQHRIDLAKKGGSSQPLKVKARVGSHVINARLDIRDGNASLKIPRGINSPQISAALEQLFRKETPVTVEYSGDRYSQLAANISWLRSGYLAAFALFGYKVVFDPAMQIVRTQILKNEARRMVSFITNIPPALQSQEPFLAFIESSPLERGLCVVFGRHGVLLPGPGDMDFYDRIAADIDRRAGAAGTLTVRVIGWPNGPVLGTALES